MSNRKEPHVLDIKKDKNYAWCQCSESEGQPFCEVVMKKLIISQ